MNRNDLYQDREFPNKFWGWLSDNEHIYQGFVELALKMKRKGRERWSARAIIHVLRWHTALKSEGDVFKVNNNYSSGLARLAMHEFPELNDFFITRA